MTAVEKLTAIKIVHHSFILLPIVVIITMIAIIKIIQTVLGISGLTSNGKRHYYCTDIQDYHGRNHSNNKNARARKVQWKSVLISSVMGSIIIVAVISLIVCRSLAVNIVSFTVTQCNKYLPWFRELRTILIICTKGIPTNLCAVMVPISQGMVSIDIIFYNC